MKLFSTIVFFSLITTFCFSQEKIVKPNTIENQFDEIYRTSTNYQTYKVISKDKYNLLKQNALDSIEKSKKAYLKQENLLKNEHNSIAQLKEKLATTQKDLQKSLQNENSISLAGLSLDKTNYNIILWSIIVVLITVWAFFVFKFLRSNILTKEAQENLLNVEKEFEIHRKKSIEREQKLRRKLQDEINKQRNA